MTEFSETLKPIETKTQLNPDLNRLINDSLKLTLKKFYDNNDINDEKVFEYTGNLGPLCDSVDKESGYSCRGQKYDPISKTFYIHFSPEENINTERKAKDGLPSLIIKDPIKTTQIAIRSFCEYKGQKPDPAKIFSQSGYEIDFSTQEVSFNTNENKISFSPKLAGLGIRIYKDGRCVSFLKNYIGNEDFRASKIRIELDQKSINKVLDYLSSTPLPNPTNNF